MVYLLLITINYNRLIIQDVFFFVFFSLYYFSNLSILFPSFFCLLLPFHHSSIHHSFCHSFFFLSFFLVIPFFFPSFSFCVSIILFLFHSFFPHSPLVFLLFFCHSTVLSIFLLSLLPLSFYSYSFVSLPFFFLPFIFCHSILLLILLLFSTILLSFIFLS